MTHEEEIEDYLNKNYIISEKRFFKKNDNKHEWGCDIMKSLPIIFGYEDEICRQFFEAWGLKNGFSFLTFEEDWRLATQPKKLKTNWTPELAQDISSIDVENELIYLITEEIYKEIGHDILIEMRDEMKSGEDFLSIMKCLGYQTTPTIYNPHTFAPYKGFLSTNYNEMMEERKINRIWKKWEAKKK